MRTVGQYMMQMGGTFAGIMSIGAVLRSEGDMSVLIASQKGRWVGISRWQRHIEIEKLPPRANV